MALTDEQEVALYEILEIPMSETINKLAAPDNIYSQPLTVSSSVYTATTRLQEFITAMETNNSGRFEVLKDHLDEWVSTAYQASFIDSGSVGSIGGITVDPNIKRDLIARKVRVIVPFYRKHEELEVAKSNIGSVNLIR